jgi:hypothetical protein
MRPLKHSRASGTRPLARILMLEGRCGCGGRAAVLSESKCCPFTKQPLRRDQITALNENNIEHFRDKIVAA